MRRRYGRRYRRRYFGRGRRYARYQAPAVINRLQYLTNYMSTLGENRTTEAATTIKSINNLFYRLKKAAVVNGNKVASPQHAWTWNGSISNLPKTQDQMANALKLIRTVRQTVRANTTITQESIMQLVKNIRNTISTISKANGDNLEGNPAQASYAILMYARSNERPLILQYLINAGQEIAQVTQALSDYRQVCINLLKYYGAIMMQRENTSVEGPPITESAKRIQTDMDMEEL